MQFPYHPSDNGKHSRFPRGFNGCYGCGSSEHSFREFSTNSTSEGKEAFHFDLHCHKPEIYFKHRDRQHQFIAPQSQQNNTLQAQQSTPLPPAPFTSFAPPPGPPLGRGRDVVRQDWMSNNTTSTYNRAGENFAKEFVINLKVSHFNDNTIRRMPISSDNLLPHIKFPIGSRGFKAAVVCLFDTGAALNTGQLAYHKNIMNDPPSLVHSFEGFDGPNPFDPITLCGSVTDPSSYDETLHGALLALI